MDSNTFYFTHCSTINNGTVELIKVPKVIGWFRVDVINAHVWQSGIAHNAVNGELVSLCSTVIRKEVEPLPKTIAGYFNPNTIQKNIYDFWGSPYMGRTCGKHTLGISNINGEIDLVLKRWDNTNPSNISQWAIEMLFTRVEPNTESPRLPATPGSTQLILLPKQLPPPPVLSCQLIITGQTTRIPLGISGRFRMRICQTSFLQDTLSGAITAITSPSFLIYNPTNMSSADNQFFNRGSIIINTFPLSSVFCEPIEVLCDIDQQLQIIAYNVGSNTPFNVVITQYIAMMVSFYSI